MKKLYQDRDWLYARYWDDGLSAKKIAKVVSVGATTIFRWMIRLDIERRDAVIHNSVEISQELREIIDGALLGDWYVGQTSPIAASLQSSGKYQQFMVWFASLVSSLGLEMSNVSHFICTSFEYGEYDSYACCSKSYPELLSIRNTWYPNGKKIVPQDLVMTPTMALHWFIGDGCLSCRGDGRPRIVLNTQGFTNGDIDRLVGMLVDNRIKAKRHVANRVIYIGTKASPAFLDYIGPCPPEVYNIYGYKFDLSRRGTIEEWRKEHNAYPSNTLPVPLGERAMEAT